MRFITGAKVKEAVFTIVPARRQVLPDMSTIWTKPLRAVFRDHHFDSEVAQKGFSWTDEERIKVEQGLRSHRRYRQMGGRGIFLDRTATQTQLDAGAVESEERAKQRGLFRRCLYFEEKPDGTTQQCDRIVTDEEADLCPTHQDEVVGAKK